jgi:hypothetical protein
MEFMAGNRKGKPVQRPRFPAQTAPAAGLKPAPTIFMGFLSSTTPESGVSLGCMAGIRAHPRGPKKLMFFRTSADV